MSRVMVVEVGATPLGTPAGRNADPLVRALARYVAALHRRYPDGPDQARREGLNARAKVSRMRTITQDPAA